MLVTYLIIFVRTSIEIKALLKLGKKDKLISTSQYQEYDRYYIEYPITIPYYRILPRLL